MKENSPIRMCISCKLKTSQHLLKRYRVINGKIEFGRGDGRSFYICDECLKKDEKTLKKVIQRYTKGALIFEASNLKEKLLDEQC
ncbi:hypothetical protein KDD93_06985 [Campylobacter sp. faydin G-24]|uniref:DUF448 domain-containing protein n=1 Tax=Campylobacter anatolicus TaxID=2829105 RepID=A0ABS5HJ56_9BACT|nr:hypothetical protein [Campylobacter anatolicus]MBR8461908.1 hypothetical protein [Campylobacter anatolicus]MBR8464305.1 hypothetical protein [Campylobacter anatolicus]MBR8465001.1 hypothetical protein [Campylobacter anatolicus]